MTENSYHNAASAATPDPETSTNLDWALHWAALGFRVLPVPAGVRGPRLFGWQHKATTDEQTIRGWFEKNPHLNIGLSTAGWIVVDVDVKKGKPGLESLKALGPLPHTRIHRTGTGGLHIFFKKPAGIEAGSPTDVRPGIDIRADGAQVIAPGSFVDDKPYTVECDAPIAEAPPAVLALLKGTTKKARKPKASTPGSVAKGCVLDAPENIARARAYLATAPQAVDGAGGDPTTYKVACKVFDFGLSVAAALDVMADWDARNDPPWGDDLRIKVESAWRNRQNDVGVASPGAARAGFGQGPASAIIWPRMIGPEGKQRPDPKQHQNTKAFLDHLGARAWQDTFTGTIRFEGLKHPQLDDDSLRWLWAKAHELGLRVEMNDLHALLWVVSLDDPRHPVRDYLAGLSWDGVKRLDKWLIRYFGADDTELNAAFGRCTLIGAVRRVRDPGCKHDAALVLEGATGTGKSKAIKALAGSWFGDAAQLSMSAKELIEVLQGVWLCEIAELEGISRREVEHVKHLLSREVDTARAAYGRVAIPRKRQFVFIGTTNESTYLKDTTNRRFWPVKARFADNVAIERDRDQLWAEAAHREANGEPNNIPDKLFASATEAQAERLSLSPLEEKLQPLVDEWKQGGVWIPLEELWKATCFGGEAERHRTVSHRKQISRAVAGWTKKKRNSGRMTVYELPDAKGATPHELFWDPKDKAFRSKLAPAYSPSMAADSANWGRGGSP